MGIIWNYLTKKFKKPEVPATPEEIAQLELEAKKAELKARIDKAHYKSQETKKKSGKSGWLRSKWFDDFNPKDHDAFKKKISNDDPDKFKALGL